MTQGVRLVVVDLVQPRGVVEQLDRSLPPEERAGARPAVRVARAAARDVLGRELGRAPADVAISRHCAHCGHPTHGRPTLAGEPSVSFSLSHSGDRALFALVAGGRAIGVDVEAVRARAHLARLAARVLGPDDLAAWRALPEAERLAGFLRVWTMKEAYLKARGVGIATTLADVPAAPSGWTVQALDTATGYVAALAVEAVGVVVEQSVWTPEFIASGGTGG